jgi:hypothetical protein
VRARELIHSARSRVHRSNPVAEFRSWHYQRHNQRRLEHLASLGLPLNDRTVIEVGAGIGDHTSFFLDRGCSVISTEGRQKNVQVLRRRYPDMDVRILDLDAPDRTFTEEAEVVHCYGTLYHLSEPTAAIAFMAARTTDLLLLETCVSPGLDESVNFVEEDRDNVSQAVSGRGCRPTRRWIWARLAEQFPHVYLTKTQPWHDEFPVDWSFEWDPARLTRAVFVASRTPLEQPRTLSTEILQVQARH